MKINDDDDSNGTLEDDVSVMSASNKRSPEFRESGVQLLKLFFCDFKSKTSPMFLYQSSNLSFVLDE